MTMNFDEVQLQEGQVLFKAGDPADKLYFIQSGSIGMADKNTGVVFATLKEGRSEEHTSELQSQR